jgi:hypothetical protein
LCQARCLRCCAPRQGTYLGFVATAMTYQTRCIHPHLTQRASRDLIRASLGMWFGQLQPPDLKAAVFVFARSGFVSRHGL